MKTSHPPVSRFLACLTLAGLSYAATAQGQVFTPVPTQGNGFYYNSSGSSSLNATTGAYARFTAPESSIAQSVSINVNAVTGGATSMTYGLQLDDGTGKPTGVFVASNTTTPVKDWNTISIPDYQLTAGQVYYVVAQPVTTGTVTWRILTGSSAPGTQPYGIVDPSFARGAISNGAPGGTATSSANVYMVGTTGRSIGEPYTGGGSANAATTGAIPAQRFQFTPVNPLETAFASVTLRLALAATLPANDLTVVLLDDSDTVLSTSTLLTSSLGAVSTTGDYTVDFADKPILTSGSSYRLALYSAGSAGNSIKWAYDTVDTKPAFDNYASATFQGENGYAFTYGNTGFTTQTAPVLSTDYIFTYTTAIPEPGSLALGLIGLVLVSPLLRRKALAV